LAIIKPISEEKSGVGLFFSVWTPKKWGAFSPYSEGRCPNDERKQDKNIRIGTARVELDSNCKNPLKE
jgi:hypothetical protein